jgi:hypothetical protein
LSTRKDESREGPNTGHEITVMEMPLIAVNKSLHWTGIPLRSIPASELDR